MMSRYLPLVCLALAHTLVDASAQLVEPLWPNLTEHFLLAGAGALSIAFIVQALPTSLSQAVFGYFRDRRNTPWLLWAGPVLGAACMCSVGLTSSQIVLGLLLLAGGLGIGAFHPEAAVAAGRALPEHRTRGLSLFMFGGALGLGLGPTLGGAVAGAWGLQGLIYVLPVMLALVAVLWFAGRLNCLSQPATEQSRATLADMLQGRGRLAVAILLICSIRLVPNMAMGKVLAFTLHEQGYDELAIGLYQSLFLVAASAGMFAMAMAFRPGWEQRFMIICPLLGAPLLCLLATDGLPEWLFLIGLAATGVVLWGTTPAMVSYAQQQFPNGAGIASALTMGLAWGVGGLIHTPITAHFSHTAAPQEAFYAFVPAVIIAGAAACWLPRTRSVERNVTGLPLQIAEPQSFD